MLDTHSPYQDATERGVDGRLYEILHLAMIAEMATDSSLNIEPDKAAAACGTALSMIFRLASEAIDLHEVAEMHHSSK